MKEQFQDYMKWKLGMEIDRCTEDTNQIFLNTSFIVIYILIAILSIGFSEKIKSKSSIGDNIEKYYLNIHIMFVIIIQLYVYVGTVLTYVAHNRHF